MDNPVHQSARSACSAMFVPQDRRMTRAVWQALWRHSRMVWRETKDATETAMTDLMIYGTSFMKAEPQADRVGKRHRLPFTLRAVNPYIEHVIDDR